MATSWSSWCWQLRLASSSMMGGLSVLSGNCTLVQSQIVPDSTLGAESSVVTPTNIDGRPTERIDSGASRGANLFHSFEQFSVPTGGGAYFNNALDIQNIISRVTGSSISNIDGLIRANGTANLFLLNPNGIIFGPNATLNIGGSFLGSTASAVNFADGTQFSATTHSTTPLLTVSVPLGLQFGPTVGEIRVQGPGAVRDPNNGMLLNREAGLSVNPEETLALVGSDIALEGGILTTDGGRIELGSVAGPSLVSLTPTDKGWSLDYKGVQNFQNIQLYNRAAVDASGAGGGDVQVQGRRVTLSNSSQIEANTLRSESGGTLTVRASELVELIGTSTGLAAQVYPGATGAGGNVTLETGQFIVRNGAVVSASTFGQGKGGNLVVTASDSVKLVGFGSSLFTQAQGAGPAGDLSITTRRLSAQDGAVVSAGTFGQGKGGDLVVTASDSVELSGSSLFAQTQGAGAAGNLTITTRRLSAQDGAVVSASTSKEGQGGKLVVTASESVKLKGTSPEGIVSRLVTQTQGAGTAGDLTINTEQLFVQEGAQVSASTFGQGDGGELRVNATNSVNLAGIGPRGFSSGLFTRSTEGGQGGNITVDTSAFRVADGAVVDARTITAGSGGNITVTADTFEAVNGGQLLASAFRGSSGRAGNITVNTTDSVTISGSVPTSVERLIRVGLDRVVENDDPTNSGLFVLSRGSGNAGNLKVEADSIRLDNRATFSADTRAGQGNIFLRSGDLVLRRGSNITTNATGKSAGGNITIDTSVIAALENSDISANAQEAIGGRVIIEAQGIFGTEFREQPTPESDITATSDLGPQFSGTVEINTLDIDPSRGLVNLPAIPIDTEVVQACTPGGSQQQSKFVVTGRGGLPSSPNEALSTEAAWEDWRIAEDSEQPATRQTLPVSSAATNNQQRIKDNGQRTIVEAQGWVFDAQGNVVLTAEPVTVKFHGPNLNTPTCQQLTRLPSHLMSVP